MQPHPNDVDTYLIAVKAHSGYSRTTTKNTSNRKRSSVIMHEQFGPRGMLTWMPSVSVTLKLQANQMKTSQRLGDAPIFCVRAQIEELNSFPEVSALGYMLLCC